MLLKGYLDILDQHDTSHMFSNGMCIVQNLTQWNQRNTFLSNVLTAIGDNENRRRKSDKSKVEKKLQVNRVYQIFSEKSPRKYFKINTNGTNNQNRYQLRQPLILQGPAHS